MSRENISNSVRFKVFKRDHFTCQYCGRSGVELEVDHIEPVSKGGTNDIGNLITACKDCNRGKRDIEVLPNGYILVKESKTKRVSLLLRPSIYQAAKEKAETNNQSFNDWVNDLLEKTISEVSI